MFIHHSDPQVHVFLSSLFTVLCRWWGYQRHHKVN